MAFDFEHLKQTVVSAGKEVADKAKETSSIAKLKLDIRTKEDFLTKQYAELGKAFYQAHKNEDVAEKAFFPTIAEAEEEVNRLNDELMDLQGGNHGRPPEKTAGFCAGDRQREEYFPADAPVRARAK